MTTDVDPQERPLVPARGGLRLPRARRTPRAPRARETAGSDQRTGELTYRDAGPERPAPPAPRTPRWEEKRRAQEEAQAEAMGLLAQITAHLGGLLNLQKAAPTSDVLYSGTRIIPASGFDTLEWGFNFASMTVTNLGAASVVVTSDGPSGSATAPSAGAGVHTIPSGVERTFAARGHSVTLYGPANAIVLLQVYTRQRPPYSGLASQAGSPGTAPLLVLANPAAGADFSFNPSPGASWQPIALFGQLITSAVVANRLVNLRLTSPTPVTLFQTPTPLVIPASTTLQLSAAQAVTNTAVNTGANTEGLVGLPDAWLPAGTLLTSATLNLQAADQWSLLALLYQTLA